MAKNYKDTEQAFGMGDIALLDGKFKVKILEVIQDEDNSWWYEVEGVDLLPEFRGITREVSQSSLEYI